MTTRIKCRIIVGILLAPIWIPVFALMIAIGTPIVIIVVILGLINMGIGYIFNWD